MFSINENILPSGCKHSLRIQVNFRLGFETVTIAAVGSGRKGVFVVWALKTSMLDWVFFHCHKNHNLEFFPKSKNASKIFWNYGVNRSISYILNKDGLRNNEENNNTQRSCSQTQHRATSDLTVVYPAVTAQTSLSFILYINTNEYINRKQRLQRFYGARGGWEEGAESESGSMQFQLQFCFQRLFVHIVLHSKEDNLQHSCKAAKAVQCYHISGKFCLLKK